MVDCTPRFPSMSCLAHGSFGAESQASCRHRDTTARAAKSGDGGRPALAVGPRGGKHATPSTPTDQF